MKFLKNKQLNAESCFSIKSKNKRDLNDLETLTFFVLSFHPIKNEGRFFGLSYSEVTLPLFLLRSSIFPSIKWYFPPDFEFLFDFLLFFMFLSLTCVCSLVC